MIRLSLAIVVAGGLSLRAMQTVWAALESFFGEAPSYSSVRLWLYRVGLYLWHSTPARHDDWIFLMDHVAERADGKCLLIVGVRRSALRASHFQLTHQDVTVLFAQVMASSNGETIKSILTELTAVTGIPVQIVSDHGSDILKGEQLFQADHPSVALTWDITHRLARLWLAAIRDDPEWRLFQRRCGECRAKTERGPLRFLVSPSQTGATRCEHFDHLTLWGEQILRYNDAGDFHLVNPQHVWDVAAEYEIRRLPQELTTRLQPLLEKSFPTRSAFVAAVISEIGLEHTEHLPAIIAAADVGRREFRERYGWMESFRENLQHVYVPLVRMGYLAEKLVKSAGVHAFSALHWLAEIPGDYLQNPRTQHFAIDLMRYLHTEGKDRPAENALLGTSDVLESLFGKYKSFSERGPLRELASTLLMLPLATVELTTTLIQNALEQMKMKFFEPLLKQTFGTSSLQQRRLAFHSCGDTKAA